MPRAPRVPLDLRRGVHHRPAGHRDRHQRRHGHRRAVAGRHVQPARLRRCSTTTSTRCAGDGCLMEGIGAEAASLAGHLKLSNLCWIYDNNKITIEGATSLAFSEDVPARFAGYGWAVQHVTDANDLAALGAAFEAFRAETERPTLIVVDSIIGYGAPNKAGHALRARRAAGRGRGRGDQAVLRLARGRDVPGARPRCAEHVGGGMARARRRSAPGVGGAVRPLRRGVPGAGRAAQPHAAAHPARRLGRRHPELPRRRQGRGRPRRQRQGAQRGRGSGCRG